MNEKSFYTHYLQIEIIMKNVKPFSQYLQISEWDYSASCLRIISNISPSRDVGQKHNLLRHTTGNVSWDATVSVLFMDSMCVRENREGGGSEIQFTDKMESQHRCQKWKIVSIDNWKKFALLGTLCPCRCVTADMQGPLLVKSYISTLFTESFSLFLVLGKPTAQQVGVTRGIIDVDHVHNLCLCHRDQSSCCHAVFHGTHRWRMFHL